MEVPGSPFGSSGGGGSPNGIGGRHRCRIGGTRRLDLSDGAALQDMEGCINNCGAGSNSTSRKRLRMDVDQENELTQLKQIISLRGRNFVPIVATPTTFQTEDVKQKNETIYAPLADDVLVNVRTIEQITYDAGVFFIGDHKGSYVRSSQGHVINLWRFSEASRRLYMSRSILFTNVMDFVRVKEILENI